ncbi:TPA: hypothetical protein ACOENG_002697 [Stenotrophomonas maltophilia]|jgi:hypothetical protein|uniref:hypothetical protein n=1 Tax=Stenotrophomonas TaxID=40323 RepID=UPI000B4C219C|nr:MULTISPECIES: hypothetical protein [Stenotrophomonas]MBH1697483.1 hypothetical protein [Stenotrophomonas maltophilia]MBH1711178.1 hypothetical protein [Stenotrophomonas maltophilia]MBN5078291.1 hypothetical protein [Stenotrophomonas maltophilia]MDV3511760.1 hypothetical protein [Stenotrophomonas sp. C4297]OWQ68422.1 hypothetical protein CEE58_00980 [Stenotrophomonas maltophilia]
MNDRTSELLDRLHCCEASIEVHRAYIKALEYGLRMAVFSHPAREQLSGAWLQLLPNIAAKHRDDGGELFAAAFQQALTVLTEQIGEPNSKL